MEGEGDSGGLEGALWDVGEDEASHLGLLDRQLLEELIDVWLEEADGVWALLDAVLGDEALAEDELGDELDGTGGQEDGVQDTQQEGEQVDLLEDQQGDKRAEEVLTSLDWVLP